MTDYTTRELGPEDVHAIAAELAPDIAAMVDSFMQVDPVAGLKVREDTKDALGVEVARLMPKAIAAVLKRTTDRAIEPENLSLADAFHVLRTALASPGLKGVNVMSILAQHAGPLTAVAALARH
jgi:hypothetical protein